VVVVGAGGSPGHALRVRDRCRGWPQGAGAGPCREHTESTRLAHVGTSGESAAALTKMGSITHSREMARGALLSNALEIEDMT
jgi:hypothetical protein